MHRDKITIIGGYGAVGSILSQILAEQFPGKVVIVGRELQRGRQLAERLGSGVSALAVDVQDPGNYRSLFSPNVGAAIVVSCVELPRESRLPQETLEHGIHYTELSATYESHQRLFALDTLAKKHGASAVVGVGLIPGLSNVMAYYAAKKLDGVDEVRINLMLGLGEAHGIDAIRWMLSHMNEKYKLNLRGTKQIVAAFSLPHTTTFLHEKTPRTFYTFNISDQHELTATIDAAIGIISRIAFDSRLVTMGIAFFRKLGLLRWAQNLNPAWIQNMRLGSESYALQIEVTGRRGNQQAKVVTLAYGEKEARVTAVVAAYVSSMLYLQSVPKGVQPIETTIAATELFGYLEQNGVQVIAQL